MAGNYDALITGTFTSPYPNRECGCPRCNERYDHYRLRSENESLYHENRRLKEELWYRRSVNRPDWVEITKPKANMNKLTILAKKILDADTKVFVKAGILDESLEITDEGVDFLLAQYLADNKERLAKAAKELIKEEEADKK